MELNSGLREMISALRAIEPDMGLKSFTKNVNARLPPDIQVEKHIIRDFIRGLDETKNKETAADETTTETTAAKQATTLKVASKPRDETFNELTKQFFVAYRARERHYLLNLDINIEHKVRSDRDGKVIHPATLPVAHLRHHIEILLTLKGINPSTLIIKAHHDDSFSRVLTGVVLKCLAPLLESLDLESYGFRLHYLAASALASDDRVEGTWVFADAESPRWPLVRDLFFKHAPDRFVPARITGAALGYPVEYPGEEVRAIRFFDDTEKRFIEKGLGEKLCCLEAFKFPVGNGGVSEWKTIMSYYSKCRKAALEAGTDIVLDLHGHDPMAEWLMQTDNYNIRDWSEWSPE